MLHETFPNCPMSLQDFVQLQAYEGKSYVLKLQFIHVHKFKMRLQKFCDSKIKINRILTNQIRNNHKKNDKNNAIKLQKNGIQFEKASFLGYPVYFFFFCQSEDNIHCFIVFEASIYTYSC